MAGQFEIKIKIANLGLRVRAKVFESKGMCSSCCARPNGPTLIHNKVALLGKLCKLWMPSMWSLITYVILDYLCNLWLPMQFLITYVSANIFFKYII